MTCTECLVSVQWSSVVHYVSVDYIWFDEGEHKSHIIARNCIVCSCSEEDDGNELFITQTLSDKKDEGQNTNSPILGDRFDFGSPLVSIGNGEKINAVGGSYEDISDDDFEISSSQKGQGSTGWVSHVVIFWNYSNYFWKNCNTYVSVSESSMFVTVRWQMRRLLKVVGNEQSAEVWVKLWGVYFNELFYSQK